MPVAADVDEGSIVVDDEPGAPRRTAVRVMHDICSWLLGLGLSEIAGRAFVVAEESERLAVKKAKVWRLPVLHDVVMPKRLLLISVVNWKRTFFKEK